MSVSKTDAAANAGGGIERCDPALAEALAAVARGRRVLPVKAGGKAALLKQWPERASSDPATIRRWAEKWPACNWGVLCGAASGLIVLDVDPRSGGVETLAALQREHGTPPETAEVLTGGGGRHVYFACPIGDARGWTVGPGVEVKAEGQYVVLAGSTHPSGGVYAWRDDHGPGKIALAEPPDWLLRPMTHETHAVALRRRHDEAADGDDGGAPGPEEVRVLLSLDPDVRAAVDRDVRATLPRKVGERRAMLYELARRLKAIPSLARLWALDLRPVVLAWHALAFEHVGTKPLRPTLTDFGDAWRNARLPHGSVLLGAAERAEAADDPPEAARLGYDEDMRFGVRLVRELSRERRGGDFYLGCRAFVQAARHVGRDLDRNAAAGLLRTYRDDGVLRLSKPHRGTNRAAEYRYLLPDGGSAKEARP